MMIGRRFGDDKLEVGRRRSLDSEAQDVHFGELQDKGAGID